jgi:hypothetical protein
MTSKIGRLALAVALVGALSASLLPVSASARKSRPSSSSSGGSASAGQRTSAGSATITRGSGSGRASGSATYGYYGRGRWYGYGYGYGYPYGYPYGYYSQPYYWYLAYPGLFYWYWSYPWLYDGWCPYPGSCTNPAYKVLRYSANPGAVETDIKPKKAEVLVDGQLVGEARDYNGNWDLLFLKPGLRSIEFRAPGYMTLTLWVDVASGGYIRIKDKLAEGEGSDPRSMKRPARPEKAAEEAKPDEDAFAPDEGLPQGLLRIEASPPDAAIYLDGEFLARAEELARLHGALPVALGRHMIEVVRPGYIAESREVMVEQGEPQKVRISLTSKDGSAGN